MIDVGQIALQLALAIALYTAIVSLIGARRAIPELLHSARNGVLALGGLLTVVSGVLIYALVTRSFELKYVAQYTSRDLSLPYTLSAFYAGNEGSLLLWAWVLSIFAVVVVLQNRYRNQMLMPYVITVLMGTVAFFVALMAFVSNPFVTIPVPPFDGNGLNPLLQNPGMFFHPPTLYLGYVGFAVPFSFAIAALITGRLGDEWIRSTRRWTLFAWFFLALGNLFGAQWAYVELGWGGYWAWDPVENASFMPWLVATAYLHSVMIQERRGMLKVWNLVLIMLTFVLSIFGTFLTRSGVLSSVHSFGQSSLGPFFFAFMGITLVTFLSLLMNRLPQLKSENELDSLVSRESSFLVNNLILVGAAFATFWGTVFPLISEWVRGVKVTVGPPFFNQVNGPIFIALIFIMGICPLIGWRRATGRNLFHNFRYPFLSAVVLAIIVYVMGRRAPYAMLAFSLCAFVTVTILLELGRGTLSRHRTAQENYLKALVTLIGQNKPRYGGYVVHLGIIVIAIGIVGSSFYNIERQITFSKDQTVTVGKFELKYKGFSTFPTASKVVNAATLEVYNGGKYLGSLTPEKNHHRNQEESHSQVAIRTTLTEDLYLILAGWGDDGTATIKILVNPLVVWVWIGGGILLIGTVIAFWPDARERRRIASRQQEANDVG